MKARRIVFSALIAALYATLTLVLAPISYGEVQFRISELLILLVLVDPFYIGGLTLGCFIANLLGPIGLMDVIFGTSATFISLLGMVYTVKIMKKGTITTFIASLWPVIVNGIVIGFELNYLYQLPLMATMLYVALGEFVVVTVIGIPVFSLLNRSGVFKYMKSIQNIQ